MSYCNWIDLITSESPEVNFNRYAPFWTSPKEIEVTLVPELDETDELHTLAPITLYTSMVNALLFDALNSMLNSPFDGFG